MIIIKFQVEVVETLSQTINIEANTPDEALVIVTQRYRNEEIVLDSSDFVDVDFCVKMADEPEHQTEKG